MSDGMVGEAARARVEALFRKHDGAAVGSRRAIDPSQAEQAEETARLRALRLAKEAERGKGRVGR